MFLICSYSYYTKYEDAVAAVKAAADANDPAIVLKHNGKTTWNSSNGVPLPEFSVCTFHRQDKKVVKHGSYPDRETAVKAAIKVYADTGMQTTVTDVNGEEEGWVSHEACLT